MVLTDTHTEDAETPQHIVETLISPDVQAIAIDRHADVAVHRLTPRPILHLVVGAVVRHRLARRGRAALVVLGLQSVVAQALPRAVVLDALQLLLDMHVVNVVTNDQAGTGLALPTAVDGLAGNILAPFPPSGFQAHRHLGAVTRHRHLRVDAVAAAPEPSQETSACQAGRSIPEIGAKAAEGAAALLILLIMPQVVRKLMIRRVGSSIPGVPLAGHIEHNAMDNTRTIFFWLSGKLVIWEQFLLLFSRTYTTLFSDFGWVHVATLSPNGSLRAHRYYISPCCHQWVLPSADYCCYTP